MTGISMFLEGRVAVVTGGSRGIGAAIVRMFVEAGGRVVFNYQKAKEEAQRLVEQCGGEKACVAVQAELSSVDSARRLVEAAHPR